MSILGRSLFISWSLIGAVALASGCQDSDAKRRAEVQQTITQATVDLARAEAQLQSPDQRESAQQAIQRVISSLSSTREGEKGQQAAAMQLAANGHRQLAAISVAAAHPIEAQSRARRAVVDGMIDAANRLDALAAGLEALDTSDVETRLSNDGRAADQALTIFADQVASLDGPIAELERDNRADREEAAQLREKATMLRREADDLGPVEGYPAFSDALDLDRQADEIEMRVAERELELRYDLRSRHALAENSVEQIQNRIATLESAQQTLDDRADALAGEAESIRDVLMATRDTIDAELQALDAGQAQLDGLYEEAAEHLDRAASKANSAAGLFRGDNTSVDGARLEAARAQQALGSLHQNRARGLHGQAALLRRLDMSADVIGLDVDTASAEAALEEAVASARTAYGESGGLLGQVSGRTGRARLETLRKQIAALESGAEVEPPAQQPAAQAQPRGRRGGAAPSGGGGAASPQELVATINAVNDPASLLVAMNLVATDGFDPPTRQFYNTIVGAVTAVNRLDMAAKGQFGQSLTEVVGEAGGMAAAGGMAPDFGNLQIGSVSGNSGTLTFADPDGVTQEVPIRSIGGRWYVELPQDMTGGGEDATPEEKQMAAGMMQMFSGIIMQVTKTANQLAQRTENGEFATIDDLGTTIDETLQQMMQQFGPMFGMPDGAEGMPGGPGGRPRRPGA